MTPPIAHRGRKRCANCFAYATAWLCIDCWRAVFVAGPIAAVVGGLSAATVAWWLGACR